MEGVRAAIGKPGFETLGSDERSIIVLTEATRKPKAEPVLTEWKPDGTKVAAKIKNNWKAVTLSLMTTGADHSLGTYLIDRLEDLYADWKSKQEN